MLFTIRKLAQVSLPKHIWFWYLSIVIIDLCMSSYVPFDKLTAFAFLRNPLSSKEIGLHSQSAYHIIYYMDRRRTYQVNLSSDTI